MSQYKEVIIMKYTYIIVYDRSLQCYTKQTMDACEIINMIMRIK